MGCFVAFLVGGVVFSAVFFIICTCYLIVFNNYNTSTMYFTCFLSQEVLRNMLHQKAIFFWLKPFEQS